MKRKFNDTGLCIPDKHYMADMSAKLATLTELVEEGALAISLSFEGIGDTVFENEEVLSYKLL